MVSSPGFERGGMYEVKIYPELALSAITFQGLVDFELVQKSIEELGAHPDFSPDYRGVVDHRKSDIRMSPSEVRQVASMVQSTDTTRGRWAMLVDTPQVTALGTIYVEAIQGQHEETLFSTIEAASNYLEIDLSGIVAQGPND
jgi:hypothetical protein